MALLQPNPGLYRFQLQPGETLTVTTDGASICRYGQLHLHLVVRSASSRAA